MTATVEELRASAAQASQKAEEVATRSSDAMGPAPRGPGPSRTSSRAWDDISSKVDEIAADILALSEQTQQIGEITLPSTTSPTSPTSWP